MTKETKEEKEILDSLEESIKNNNTFDKLPLKIHTVPIDIQFYIKYQRTPNIAKSQFVDNTINRYIEDIYNAKKLYLKKSDNINYAKKDIKIIYLKNN